MKCLAHATVLVLLSSGLIACGQKGPLVLPDAPAKHKRTVPQLPSPAKPKDSGNAPAPAEASPATASPPPAPPPSSTPATPASTPPTPGFNGPAAATLTPAR